VLPDPASSTHATRSWMVRSVLLLVLLSVVLAGCPASPTSSASTGESAAPAPTTTEPAETQQPAATEEPDETTGSESAGDFPTADEADLLSHVPESFRDTCERVEFWFFEAETQIICDPDGPEDDGPDNVAFGQYSGTDAMNGEFEDNLELVGAGEGDCTTVLAEPGAVFGPYTIEDADVGRALCDHDESSAFMMWADERLNILASASREDADMEALYEWWTGDSGPIE
jgi:hypothetical protein